MSAAKNSMSASEFRNWRKGLGLKQKDVADLLGLKKRVIQYYEKGERDGKRVEIPKTVRLACYALSAGVDDFDGQIPRRGRVRPATLNGQPADQPPQRTLSGGFGETA